MKWDYNVPGIPDNYFDREESIPMTKEEIRALALSKARVRKGDKFLDIGCGTGSVTVEAALLVGENGKVYGIDKDEKAINLTRRNTEKFGVANRVVVIHGEVPQILESINEKFDVVFIGGGSEVIDKVIPNVKKVMNKGARIVVDAILVETVNRALSSFEVNGFTDIDVTEVIIAKGLKTKYGTAMISRNPIFIISGELP